MCFNTPYLGLVCGHKSSEEGCLTTLPSLASSAMVQSFWCLKLFFRRGVEEKGEKGGSWDFLIQRLLYNLVYVSSQICLNSVLTGENKIHF